MTYDCLYVQFLYYFNVKRDYFECHEVLEELWLNEGRPPLYQGLLQVAVGLYHHRNQNHRGAVKLLKAALEKLSLPSERRHGIDLPKLMEEAEAYLSMLVSAAEKSVEPYDLNIVITDPDLHEQVQFLILQPPHTDKEP